VNDECNRSLRGAIATAQLTHELSALDPGAPPRTARREGDPGPFDGDDHVPCRCGRSAILIAAGRARPSPDLSDLADSNTELNVACSMGDGR
jgi:hypothetical protein